MGQKAIPFHFSKTNSSAATTTFDRLPRHHVHRALTSHLELVADHVSKSLVMNDTKEDVSRHGNPIRSRVQDLGAVVIVSGGFQLLPKVINGVIFFEVIGGIAKGSGIVTKAVHSTRFASHALDHHGDCHT